MEHESIRETDQNRPEEVAPTQGLPFDLFGEAEDEDGVFETRTRLSSTCKLNRFI